ncbi:MAG: hypothetical protein M1838_005129 [Thelocarpon superellum]|nr:MAG: hypothetical protein M1838_005129 [Thelocarpon superellum]
MAHFSFNLLAATAMVVMPLAAATSASLAPEELVDPIFIQGSGPVYAPKSFAWGDFYHPFAALDNGPYSCLVTTGGQKRCFPLGCHHLPSNQSDFDYGQVERIDIPHGMHVKVVAADYRASYTTVSQTRESNLTFFEEYDAILTHLRPNICFYIFEGVPDPPAVCLYSGYPSVLESEYDPNSAYDLNFTWSECFNNGSGALPALPPAPSGRKMYTILSPRAGVSLAVRLAPGPGNLPPQNTTTYQNATFYWILDSYPAPTFDRAIEELVVFELGTPNSTVQERASMLERDGAPILWASDNPGQL